MKDLRALPLTGLNGATSLGFLSALGAFRAVQEIAPDYLAYLQWLPRSSSWQPVLLTSSFSSEAALVEAIHPYLAAQADQPALTIADNPKMPNTVFRAYAENATRVWLDGTNPAWVAYTAAFGSDGVVDEKGLIEDTGFRTMSGAGHQHFLRFMNEIARNTTAAQLREALFGPWQYRDTQFSMRWDSEDDRRYSVRWQNPSTEPARNVRGANRLAIEALLMFPTMPAHTHLATTGFVGRKSSEIFWTWPIWSSPISLDTCRSLLAHPDLILSPPELKELNARGVVAVFRSQRITIGKFRNFTPAQPVGRLSQQ